MELRELLNYIEFDVYKTKDKNGKEILKLHDCQEVNLGNICDEEFEISQNGIIGIIDRCEIYWNDYVITPLCEDLNINDTLSYSDVYAKVKEKYKDDSEKITVLYWLINPDKVELGNIPTKEEL